MVLLHGVAAAEWCCCVVLLRGAAAAWCCCCMVLLLHGAAAATCSSNFLIYKIEAAVEAGPAIFSKYLVTQWRQLLAAADAFPAEHWVQSRR